MEIQFLGAAKVVTGSNILVKTESCNLLLDCGLYQGSAELEELNRQDFSYDPSTIDYVFLTHAHVDHSARIPKTGQGRFSRQNLLNPGNF